jgi:hypothetical protein
LVGLLGYLSGVVGPEVKFQLGRLSRNAIVKVADVTEMVSSLDAFHRAA